MKLIVCKGCRMLCCKKIISLTVRSKYVVIGPMVLVLALVLNLVVLLTSLDLGYRELTPSGDLLD